METLFLGAILSSHYYKTNSSGEIISCRDGVFWNHTFHNGFATSIKQPLFKSLKYSARYCWLPRYVSNRKKGNESVYEPKLPTNILEFKSEKGKHPTQKPVELIKWVLKYYSNENDLCIDATMGSGSTGVACKEMNRRFIGIELDKDIYETALNRI